MSERQHSDAGDKGRTLMFVKKIKNFIHDEEGQSTTEYILILAVVVMVALKFKEKFTSTMDNATKNLDNKLNDAFE